MKKKLVFACLCCLCGMFVNAQELERGIQNAVNKLAERLQIRWDVSVAPMTMEGKEAPCPFSRQLHTLVYTYADNIPRYFRVVASSQNRGGTRRPGDARKGIINGSFALRGDMVEVSLRLVSDPDGDSLGAALPFSFPRAELPDNAFLIDNEKSEQEREQVFDELAKLGNTSNTAPASPVKASQVINVMADLISPSMTFLHRDELKMTVLADQNCYFKVIYIDVNNQMKMIYPNDRDRNNSLKKNVPRPIFENMSWRIYKPYGAETILIVASSQQFQNIEQEYNAPWKPMTADAIRTAVRGNRGIDSEPKTPITFSGAGEARYTITTLKPDEEYSYGKPENMQEFYLSTRSDVERQGGTFDGNEFSGSYIINGVRGSYRVPSNAQDTIEFAMYNNYTGGRARGQTKSSGFDFSFNRPANITQAIQMAQSGIVESGGTFYGNEREGNFNAKGIAGQYRVSDLVSVTITEKPVVIPNSLIEREIKRFFGR